MSEQHAPKREVRELKQKSRIAKGRAKLLRIPVTVESQPATPKAKVKKPAWIKAQPQGAPRVQEIKQLLRDNDLHTVCEEAACPNLGECFSHGTATFLIMGNICTRRCPFCDVAHGRPNALDQNEPKHLAKTIAAMRLQHVVITSVDRDDLKDGGATHFALCIEEVRKQSPQTRIEVLVPDFRGRMDLALEVLQQSPPDIFNHNLETVPRLYRTARPGSDYQWSLNLIQRFQQMHPDVPTKSGLMLGLGETMDEVKQVIQDLRSHGGRMLTLGQYLQPSEHHLSVERFVSPAEFAVLGEYAEKLGYEHVASGPMVRSSYHADLQAEGVGIGTAIGTKS